MRKPKTEENSLLDGLYDFGPPEKRSQYRIVSYRPIDQNAPIEGLQTKKSDRCFEATPDMTQAALELYDEISDWQRSNNNWVTIKIHEVKCPRWGDLVLYVQMITPSFKPASKHVRPLLVLEREYVQLGKYISTLMKAGPYPQLA